MYVRVESSLTCIRKGSKRAGTGEKMESWRREMKPQSRSWWRGERIAADRWSMNEAGKRKNKIVMRARENRKREESALFDAIMCLLVFSIHTSQVTQCYEIKEWVTASYVHIHACIKAINITISPSDVELKKVWGHDINDDLDTSPLRRGLKLLKLHS